MKTQNILFSILLLVSTSCNPTKGNGINWLNGKWTGTGCEPDLNSQWPIDLSYDQEENKVTVRYPSFNCIGEWELISFDDCKATFKERPNVAPGTCNVGRIVIVTVVSEKFINITYLAEDFQYDKHGFVEGFAVLRKL